MSFQHTPFTKKTNALLAEQRQTPPPKDLAAEVRAMNLKADEHLVVLRAMPRPPKRVALSAEQQRQRAAFHYERFALSRRDLSPNDARAFARRCVEAEVNGEPLPELRSPLAALEEHLAGDSFMSVLVPAVEAAGVDAVMLAVERAVKNVSQAERTAKGAPLSALERIQTNVLLNQVGRNNVEKAQAEKLARDSMPAQVDVAGHAGRNLTERICSALKTQGYGRRLPADQLITLAARMKREGRVIGA